MARRGFFASHIYWLLTAGCALSAGGGMSPSSPQMPLTFVENRGQTDPRVRAIGSGPKFKAWFEGEGVVLQQGSASMYVGFEGAGPHAEVRLTDPIGATANYFHGNEPGHAQTNIPLFGAVHYDGVWPGVDVMFHQALSQMEVEYTLAPGAEIGKIRLRYSGAVSIQTDGSLLVRGESGEFREKKPYLYQETTTGRVTVPGKYVVTSDGSVSFSARYDRTLPLVIDPTILFGGYFGGTAQDTITAVTVTSSFNIVVAGWGNSIDLPTSSAVRAANGGGRPHDDEADVHLPATIGAAVTSGGGVDAFVANFSPVGGRLVSCSYLGGTGDDRAFGVAADSSGNIYVTGWTSSANFPVTGAVQGSLRGARDAFVAKLDSTGSTLIYSTYLGGSGVDTGNAIAVDSLGQAVIVGDTTSLNLPTTTGALQGVSGGGQDVFVARLTASGGALSFLTYFGGNGTDHGTAVQIDPTGPIVIGGGTYSTTLPVQLAVQSHSGGGQDGFVAKLNATATGLIFSTYIGGTGGSPGFPEQVNGIVIGPSKNIVAAGITSSSNFPITTTSFQPVYGGGQTDGFITKLNGTTGALMASSFLGGSQNDGINAIAVDQLGRIYATGFTLSIDFPVLRPTQAASASGVNGSMDGFVTTINSAMNQMNFGTYLGGSGSDSGNAIAVDSMASIIVAGQTSSNDFPAARNFGRSPTQMLSSFVTKFTADWKLSVSSASAGTIDLWHIAGYYGSVPASVAFTYGQVGDIPIVGDWTGTGTKHLGVFRNGLWVLDTNGDNILNAGDKTVIFGQAGDIPVVGDWDGTGKIKLGLFRSGVFILDLSGHLSGIATGVADATFLFGQAGDIPVVGDWNNTGTSKVGIFRNGSWLVDFNGDRVFNSLDKTYSYGQAGDIPITGFWDSVGLTRIGVFRAGTFILNYSGTNAMGLVGQTELSFTFGTAGSTPLSW